MQTLSISKIVEKVEEEDHRDRYADEPEENAFHGTVSFLDSTHQEQDQNDDQDDPEKSCRAVAPCARMRPGWERANQRKNKDDDQKGGQAHRLDLS